MIPTCSGPHCCSHARRTGLLQEDVVYTVRQVVSACRTISEHFTYFPCKYVKSHFSDGVNDLSKAHYFFTEVERVTKHIVTREIRDNKIRALAPARSSYRRCSSNSASKRHLTFAITNLLITDVGTAGRDILYFVTLSLILIIPKFFYSFLHFYTFINILLQFVYSINICL